MPSKKDYVPQNNAEFNTWFKNMTQYVSQKVSGTAPEWDHILKREQDALNAAYADWYTYYAPTLKPHTSDVTDARNEAKTRAKKVIRPFVKRNFYCDPVTNADRIYLGLIVHDIIRTDHTSVDQAVEWHFEIRGIRQVHLRFKVLGNKGKAKPGGYHAVVAWDILDAPPERPQDLRRHSNASRTPYTITFDETERGKKVYAALAWQNERKVTGNWSAIQWTFVP